MKRFLGFLCLMLLCGCANVSSRIGLYGSTVLCSPSPYNSTCVVWSDCVCAPFKLSGKDGFDRTWYALATVTWPFWVVDEVCEVFLDTVFLPVDGIYKLVKE